jgi:DNA modification methylase
VTTQYFVEHDIVLHAGHVLDVVPSIPAGSVHCVLTSPPYYGLRDYGVPGQIGLEESPAEYVHVLRAVFDEVRRVLRPDGVLWLNLGDSYSGSWGNQGHEPDRDDLHVRVRGRGALPKSMRTGSRKPGEPGPKNLYGLPWRVALSLQADGWTLRNAIVWAKPNGMPESVRDRLSCRYEHVFLFSRSSRYWFDLDAIKVPSTGQAPGSTPAAVAAYAAGTGTVNGARRWGGNSTSTLIDVHATRNPGDVWEIPTSPYPGAHFATFPPELARRCVRAGCPMGGTVLDPFCGSGTALMAARQLGRRGIGIDLNPAYLDLAIRRIGDPPLPFPGDVA